MFPATACSYSVAGCNRDSVLADTQPRRGHRLAVRHNPVMIGRGQDADVLIGDAEISRRHALLWREAGRVWVIDLNSSNGTAVNGLPADAPLAVEQGDVVTFGIASFKFRAV